MCLGCVWVVFGSSSGRVWVVFGLCLVVFGGCWGRVWVVFGSCSGRVRVVFASCPVGFGRVLVLSWSWSGLRLVLVPSWSGLRRVFVLVVVWSLSGLRPVFVWSLLAARLRVFFSFLLRGLFFARDEGCQSPRDVRSVAARTRGSQVQVRSGGPRLTPRYVPAVKRTSDLAAALPRFRFDGLGAPAL